MPEPGYFFLVWVANGGMSVRYCATGSCLKIVASPTGHECKSVWAWKRACCLNMVLYCHLKSYLARSTSLVARFPAEPKNDTINFMFSLHAIMSYITWYSFSEDQLVAASQSTQNSFVCKTLTVTQITLVPSTVLLHSVLHGYFQFFN